MGHSYIEVDKAIYGMNGDLKDKLGNSRVPTWLCLEDRSGSRRRKLCGGRANRLWRGEREEAAGRSRGSKWNSSVTFRVDMDKAPDKVKEAARSANIDPARATGFTMASFSGWVVEVEVAGGGRVTDVSFAMDVHH